MPEITSFVCSFFSIKCYSNHRLHPDAALLLSHLSLCFISSQVIAVVMDVFTDVDIFADILNAAMRNVPVYILLDEANVQHFVNMVNNCRVDLNSIQVRGIIGLIRED